LVLLSSCFKLFVDSIVHALLLLLRCCSQYMPQLNNSCRFVLLPGLIIWRELGTAGPAVLLTSSYHILQHWQPLAML
jgi:uncharacterized protein YycO